MWLYLTLVLVCSIGNSLEEEKAGLEANVYLTISSVAVQQLELNWNVPSVEEGDWVGIFDQDPVNTSSVPLQKFSIQEASGRVLSGVNLTKQELDFEKKCLGYWIAYIRNQEVEASDCLKSQPTWLFDMKDHIGSKTMMDVFLPGTHDAGSYEIYDPNDANGIIQKYTITQEEDILSQLILGIRYLDMRIAYYPSTNEKFWINHGAFRIRPLQEVVESVQQFLENTNEIVIFDIHELPAGFSDYETHHLLIDYLMEVFGKYILPASAGPDVPLNSIWDSGKHLIVTYPDETARNSTDLWRSVSHQWGDVQALEDLYAYFNNIMGRTFNYLWSAMAELTPTAMDVVTDRLGGLRNMSDMVNQNVTDWFQYLWGEKVNIVATDFFRGNNIVDVAIEWNLRRN